MKKFGQGSLNLFGEDNPKEDSSSLIISTKTTRKRDLTKEQKAFNRNVKQIEKLKKDIEVREEALDVLLKRYHKELLPIKLQKADLYIEFSSRLHEFMGNFNYSNSQRDQISKLIVSMMDQAFVYKEPDQNTKHIHDFYSMEGSYDEQSIEQKNVLIYDFIEMIEDEFGISIEKDDFPDLENATPEEMMAFAQSIRDKFQSDESEKNKQSKRTERKKTKKELQKEQELKSSEDLKKKNIRSLYLSLAKALHPDTASDEEERLQKEELMKKVTQAYKNKEISTLLTLELNWLKKQNSNTHLLEDNQLKLYNSALKEQIDKLKNEYHSITHHPRFTDIMQFAPYPHKHAKHLFNEELNTNKQQVLYMRKDIDQVTNKKTSLEFLNEMNQAMLNSSAPIDLLERLYDNDDEFDFPF